MSASRSTLQGNLSILTSLCATLVASLTLAEDRAAKADAKAADLQSQLDAANAKVSAAAPVEDFTPENDTVQQLITTLQRVETPASPSDPVLAPAPPTGNTISSTPEPSAPAAITGAEPVVGAGDSAPKEAIAIPTGETGTLTESAPEPPSAQGQ